MDKIEILKYHFLFEIEDINISRSISFILYHSDLENKNDLLNTYLHENELAYYNTLEFDSRKNSYLLGRVASKLAIAEFFNKNWNTYKNIYISRGFLGEPVILNSPLIISISHSLKTAVACASANDMNVGIDLEYMENFKHINSIQMTQHEYKITLSHQLFNQKQWFAILWSAKESLVKFLKIGFTLTYEMLEIKNIIINKECLEIYFSHFLSLKCYTFINNNQILSVCLNGLVRASSSC